MKDFYWMNKTTGEILTGPEAIRRYYSEEKHGYPDDWTDEWEETDCECEMELENPSEYFKKAIR